MSAENELRVFRMENGEFWIVVARCGDTVAEAQGECQGVVGKGKTYEEAEALMSEMDNESSPNYVYTEYGGGMPALEQLTNEPVRFTRSLIKVSFTGRECCCVDYRDLQRKSWRVYEILNRPWEERDALVLNGVRSRVLGEGLWYSQALTLATIYQMRQPGECAVSSPRIFRSFRRYGRHECCGEDEVRFCLPQQT